MPAAIACAHSPTESIRANEAGQLRRNIERIVREKAGAILRWSPAVSTLMLLVGLTAWAQGSSGIHWRIEPPIRTGRDFELVADYGKGTRYYLDRDYVFTSLDETLAGGFLLRTLNDIKRDSLVLSADRDRWSCHLWVDRPMVVYLLWDWRTLDMVPLWLWCGGWELTPLREYTTDVAMGFFAVLRRVLVPGDTLLLGHPMADNVPTPSMYVVILKPMIVQGDVPKQYRLGPPFPNPAASMVTIPFDLLDRAWITIRIWDARGRLVARVWEGLREPGSHRLLWLAKNDAGLPLPSGLYFVHLEARPFWSGTAKLLILN